MPHSCVLAVKFQDILYGLLSGHPLHFWDLHAKVDFADQGVAEEDQDAMVDALQSDGL
jgi:hypothetical protein